MFLQWFEAARGRTLMFEVLSTYAGFDALGALVHVLRSYRLEAEV